MENKHSFINSVKFYFSAFEFMDNDAMQTVAENLGYTNPIGEHPFYVLVETSGSNDVHDGEVFLHSS